MLCRVRRCALCNKRAVLGKTNCFQRSRVASSALHAFAALPAALRTAGALPLAAFCPPLLPAPFFLSGEGSSVRLTAKGQVWGGSRDGATGCNVFETQHQ